MEITVPEYLIQHCLDSNVNSENIYKPRKVLHPVYQHSKSTNDQTLTDAKDKDTAINDRFQSVFTVQE